MRQLIIKIVIALCILSVYLAAWHTNIFSFFNFETVQQSRDWLTGQVSLHYGPALGTFFVGYTLAVMLAIPGNFILTMLGGFLFGPLIATLVVAGAATLGSVTCVLWVRYLVGASLQRKYEDKLHDFNDHLTDYGTLYLLAARLFPFVPLVLINILVGLTQVPIRTFMWTTALGIIPVVSIYTFLGKQIMEISQLSDVITPTFLGVGVLLTALSFTPLLLARFRRPLRHR